MTKNTKYSCCFLFVETIQNKKKNKRFQNFEFFIFEKLFEWKMYKATTTTKSKVFKYINIKQRKNIELNEIIYKILIPIKNLKFG